MLAIWLVVFREVYEAALIIGIVAAATRGLVHRWRWIGGGIGLGVIGALLLAAVTGRLSHALQGMGQEWFNTAILLLATAMIAWHVLWMSRHGRELAAHANQLGKDVSSGHRPVIALMMVATLAAWREGSEVVLFSYGLLAGGSSPAELWVGGMLGLGSGVAIGVAMYGGLLRIPLRYFFKATNALLTFVAAGLSAAAAGLLVQINALPAWIDPLWDTSAWLPDQSFLASALHALVGYVARPNATQVAVYAAVLLVLFLAQNLANRSPKESSS